MGALVGAILLLTFVALLYTALSRRRRVQQHARALAEGGCGSAGSSERDKDSANEKSCHKIPVRAAHFAYVHTASVLCWHGSRCDTVIDGAPEEGRAQATCELCAPTAHCHDFVHLVARVPAGHILSTALYAKQFKSPNQACTPHMPPNYIVWGRHNQRRELSRQPGLRGSPPATPPLPFLYDCTTLLFIHSRDAVQ